MKRADSQSLESIRAMMARLGVRQLLMKPLAPNDNSKNQPYFGGDFGALNLLPVGKPTASRNETNRQEPIFKSELDLGWLGGDGSVSPAPNAKLILYPQYPEVRLSGYLSGADPRYRPSDVLGQVRTEGRFLVLGTTEDGRILGVAAGPTSRLARELRRLRGLEQVGVFYRIPMTAADTAAGRRSILLTELCRIANCGWIDSKRLTPQRRVVACAAPNCGGYTLEAELGIAPNSYAEPDFHGWEVKQHAVGDFLRPANSIITLMTPEPTGGYYAEHGVLAFLQKYGYPDVAGRPNRLNFGGIFRRGIEADRTQLRLELDGYSPSTGKICDATGGFVLVDRRGNAAAVWRFSDIMAHWARKHESAVYVPSVTRESARRQYRFSKQVRLGRGTTVELLLRAVYDGDVYYDPGMKVEGFPATPRVKRRSQFRIKLSRLMSLYSAMETVNVCGDET